MDFLQNTKLQRNTVISNYNCFWSDVLMDDNLLKQMNMQAHFFNQFV